jgi:hypothetical protein
VTTDEDFYACLTKGKAEDLDLGQVLSILAHRYATTDMELAGDKAWVETLRGNRGLN